MCDSVVGAGAGDPLYGRVLTSFLLVDHQLLNVSFLCRSPFRNYTNVIFPLLHHAFVRFDPAANAFRGAIPPTDELEYHHQYVSYRAPAATVEQRLGNVLQLRPKFVTINGQCNMAASFAPFNRFLRRLYPMPSNFEVMGSDVGFNNADNNKTKSDGRPFQVPEADPAYDPLLPPGIEMTWDPGHQRYYYWNLTSRVKFWSLSSLLGKQHPRHDPIPDAGSNPAINPNAVTSLDRSPDHTHQPVFGTPIPNPFSAAPNPNAPSGASKPIGQ